MAIFINKYLNKASTIWEDFTTGKYKIKEEATDMLKSNFK